MTGRACLLVQCLLSQERIPQLYYLADERRHLRFIRGAQLLQSQVPLWCGLWRRFGHHSSLRAANTDKSCVRVWFSYMCKIMPSY